MLIIKHSLIIKTLELNLLRFDSLPLASWEKQQQQQQNQKINEKQQPVSTLNF